jgi:hypothetical protein
MSNEPILKPSYCGIIQISQKKSQSLSAYICRRNMYTIRLEKNHVPSEMIMMTSIVFRTLYLNLTNEFSISLIHLQV